MTKELMRILPSSRGFLFHVEADGQDMTDVEPNVGAALDRAFRFHAGDRSGADAAHFHEAIVLETDGGYIVLRGGLGLGQREIVGIVPFGEHAAQQLNALTYKTMLECADHDVAPAAPKKPGPMGIVN